MAPHRLAESLYSRLDFDELYVLAKGSIYALLAKHPMPLFAHYFATGSEQKSRVSRLATQDQNQCTHAARKKWRVPMRGVVTLKMLGGSLWWTRRVRAREPVSLTTDSLPTNYAAKKRCDSRNPVGLVSKTEPRLFFLSIESNDYKSKLRIAISPLLGGCSW